MKSPWIMDIGAYSPVWDDIIPLAGFHSHYCQPRRLNHLLGAYIRHVVESIVTMNMHRFGSNWGREERGWIGRMFHLLVCCNKGESPIMIIVTPTLKSWGSKVEDLIVFGALLSTGCIYRHLRYLSPLYNLHHIQPPALTLCMSAN